MKKTLLILIFMLLSIFSFSQDQRKFGNCKNGFGAVKVLETIYYIGEFNNNEFNGCGIYVITTTNSWYYGIYELGKLKSSLSKSDTEDYLITKYNKRKYFRAFKKCHLIGYPRKVGQLSDTLKSV